MKRNINISLFLLFAFSLLTSSGLAQGGGGYPPPAPCNPCAVSTDDNDQPAIDLSSSPVADDLAESVDGKVGFVRNVDRPLLQAAQISMVFRTEVPISVLDKLSYGDTVPAKSYRARWLLIR